MTAILECRQPVGKKELSSRWRSRRCRFIGVYQGQKYAVFVCDFVVAFYDDLLSARDFQASLSHQLDLLGDVAAFLGVSPTVLEVRVPCTDVEVV